MTDRKDAHTPDPSSRLWYVEGDQAAEIPAGERPRITNDDSIIAGGQVGIGAPTEADEDAAATTVMPAASEDAPMVVSTPTEPAPTSEDDDLETTKVRRRSFLHPEQDDDQPAPAQAATVPAADADTDVLDVPATEDDDAEDATVPAADADAVPEDAPAEDDDADVPAANDTDAPAAEDSTPETASDLPESPAPQAPEPYRPPVTPAATAPAPAREATGRVSLDDTLLEGATALPSIPSRVPAHLWSLLLTLLLLPVAWFCSADGVTRLFPRGGALHIATTTPNWGGVGEVALGAVALFLLVFIARWSSLGAFVWGIVAFVCGVGGMIAAPQLADYLNPTLDALDRSSGFFSNVAYHLSATLPTGVLALSGAVLIALGFVSHGARRKGRKDYIAQSTIDRIDQ